jgi:hypothetical protein
MSENSRKMRLVRMSGFCLAATFLIAAGARSWSVSGESQHVCTSTPALCVR